MPNQFARMAPGWRAGPSVSSPSGGGRRRPWGGRGSSVRLLLATGLLQGRLAGAPEEVAAHDTLDGAADILRDHEAAQRLVGGRPGGVEPERHAERQQGGVDD